MSKEELLIWRISNFADLSGEGGIYFSGRWNHKGHAIVYCSDHPSTAVLEILVNSDLKHLPTTYQLLKIQIPNKADIKTANLKKGWQKDMDYTRNIWANFCKSNSEAILKVPSVITPHTFNFLINPRKVEAAKIELEDVETHGFDERFLGGDE